MVKFLHSKRTEGCTTRAMDVAATNGDMAMLRFLQQHRGEGCTVLGIKNAARGGRLSTLSPERSVEVLQFLYESYPAMFTVTQLDLCTRLGPPAVGEWAERVRVSLQSST